MRQAGRQLERLESQALVRSGQIDLEAQLQVARVQAVAYVGRQAMFGVAMISETEAQLGQTVPEARGRVAAIANLTAMGMAEVVADTTRKVR